MTRVDPVTARDVRSTTASRQTSLLMRWQLDSVCTFSVIMQLHWFITHGLWNATNIYRPIHSDLQLQQQLPVTYTCAELFLIRQSLRQQMLSPWVDGWLTSQVRLAVACRPGTTVQYWYWQCILHVFFHPPFVYDTWGLLSHTVRMCSDNQRQPRFYLICYKCFKCLLSNFFATVWLHKKM